MENIATIKRALNSGVKVRIGSKFAREQDLKEIVFNTSNMTFRKATIFDNKTYKIGGGGFCGGFSDDIVGDYKISKSGEIFYLTPIN